MQTLHCRWHEGYREINCTARAHQHSFWQTAQYESHPERGGTSRRCLPSWLSPDLKKKYATSDNLTVKMIRKSQSNCIFSRWKDKCLFNLLFWIPNFFQTFQDYGRGGTTSLASPDGTSLIPSVFCWSMLALGVSSAASLLPRFAPGISLPSLRWTHPARLVVVALVVTGLFDISSNAATGMAAWRHVSSSGP